MVEISEKGSSGNKQCHQASRPGQGKSQEVEQKLDPESTSMQDAPLADKLDFWHS
jgi:hypothetical protein